MSAAVLAWSAAEVLLACLTGGWLFLASFQPEPSVKNGYRWLAVAAICLGVGAAAQQVFTGLIGGAQPLRVADLVSLAAWPLLVIALATLTADLAGGQHDPAGRRPAVQVPGIAVDSCLLVTSLFVISLAAFGPEYFGAEVGPAAFALDLIRPAADLIVIGLLLRLVVRSPRLALPPALAVVALTIGDSVAVGRRVGGNAPGLWSDLALAVALGLLAAAPAVRVARLADKGDSPAGRLGRAGRAGPEALRSASSPVSESMSWSLAGWSSPATLAALLAAAAAALMVTGFALGGAPVVSPALPAAGAVVMLLLVIRLAQLAFQASAAAASAQDSDSKFRALADTTIDVVVVCDRAGMVEYVSPAIAEYGYQPGQIVGTRLIGLMHPEDRQAAVAAAMAAARAALAGGGTVAFAGRVRGSDGSWRHVEASLSRYGRADEPVRLLVTARDVSDRVELRRQVAHLTFHDGRTGLPNRAYIEDRLADLRHVAIGRAGGQEAMVGAILLDLDGYATVNELVGHSGGDLLLAQAGRRLRAASPPDATVARWGGAEFAILMSDAGTQAELVDLAERLAGEIAAEPFDLAGEQMVVTASVGVAIDLPAGSGACGRADGADAAGLADDLLSNAQIAMSKARDAGGGRVEVFAAEMHAAARRRAELGADLREALAGQRLEIRYQPVVELATSRVSCVEALVRWTRAGQAIPPAEFLGVAEETGLIVELGGWVLREACRQVAAWRAAGWEIGLSVNVSARQAGSRRFAASVIAALDEAGLAPQALTIEVTEGLLIDGVSPIAADLAGLRGKGVRLAIDDFGTGRFSLAQLRQLAVDSIKIDASFVAGLGSDPTVTRLTKAIIELGRDLGLEVIAEGIERPEQLDRLIQMGCALGQGFALAGPMTAQEMAISGGLAAWSTIKVVTSTAARPADR